MLGKLKSLDARLLRRRCVECGYDGPLLRGGTAPECPRCGCDFHLRPARSYAEMEGLLGHPMTVDAPIVHRRTGHDRLIYRWLAFLFGGLMVIVAIAYLTSAVMP